MKTTHEKLLISLLALGLTSSAGLYAQSLDPFPNPLAPNANPAAFNNGLIITAPLNEDIDGDANFDQGEDLDNDGNLDVAEDLNGDGILNNGGTGQPATPGAPNTFLAGEGALLNEVTDGVDYDGNGIIAGVFNEDIDGDNTLDLLNEDLNGDGLDLNEDIDGDGNFDITNEDTNGNGVLDLGEDLDADGNLDLGLEDIDGDGNFDNIDEDNNPFGPGSNTDGNLNRNEDTDGDGNLDVNEDTDGDGVLDVAEDLNGDGILNNGGTGAPLAPGGPNTLAVGEGALLNEVADNVDYNGDGVILGTFNEDIDGDNTLDLVNEDLDGDGVLDLFAEDVNGNGVLDNAANWTNIEAVNPLTGVRQDLQLLVANDVFINGEIVATETYVDAQDDLVRAEFAAADAAITAAFTAADANLQRQINTNREDIDRNARGIAMVAALQHTTVLPGMTQALDLSAAHFEGETGLAINYSRRINDNVQINFGAATTSDGDENVVKAGIGWQW